MAKLNFSAAGANETAASGSNLDWNNVQMDDLSPAMRAKLEAVLDARKAFEDAMIAASQKAKLIGKDETLLFGYKFLNRGQVSIASAPIKRKAERSKSKFAL